MQEGAVDWTRTRPAAERRPMLIVGHTLYQLIQQGTSSLQGVYSEIAFQKIV